jgi:hypothetical protein
MYARKHLRQPFVVTRQAARAGRPGESAFDHSVTWQQDKAAFGLGQLDYRQLAPVGGGSSVAGLVNLLAQVRKFAGF